MRKYSTLEGMYRDMYKLIYTYIGDYTKNDTAAQDIASIVWGKVAENPSKFLDMEIGHLHNYMRKMVRTAVSDYFKMEKKQESFLKPEELLEAEKSVEEEYLGKEDLIYLERAREILNEDELQLIYLRFEAGLSARKVGEAFGISEGAVRVKQYRILKKIKDEIIRLQQQGEYYEEVMEKKYSSDEVLKKVAELSKEEILDEDHKYVKKMESIDEIFLLSRIRSSWNLHGTLMQRRKKEIEHGE